MVLDTSAIVAIHLKEPGHERLIEAIDQAELVVVGVPTLLETAMVLSTRLGQDAGLSFRLSCVAWRQKSSCSTRSIWTPLPPHFSGLAVAAIPHP